MNILITFELLEDFLLVLTALTKVEDFCAVIKTQTMSIIFCIAEFYSKRSIDNITMKVATVIFMLAVFVESRKTERIPQAVNRKDIEFVRIATAVEKAFELAEIFDANLIIDSNTEDLCEIVLRAFSSKVKWKIANLMNLTVNEKSATTLLILENESSLKKYFFPLLSPGNLRSEQFFLFIFLDQKQLNVSFIFKAFWELYLSNVNIILYEASTITLSTFLPFYNRNCGSLKVRIVNSFINETWKNRVIFPKKLRNLYGCPIKLSTFEYPPAIIIHKINGTEQISGHDVDLVRGIARVMNFNLSIEILKEPSAWGFLMENGTSGGVLRKIIDQEADIAVGTYYLTQTRAKFMSFSQYSRSNVVLVIPPGVPLSAFEKLYKPFSDETWMTLIIMLAAALLIIFVIRLQKKSVQHFVFGRHTGNPFINLLSIILNGSQHRLPMRNFSRTLLLLFVIFCIIIRTLYQAAMFHFLQTDQRHAEIQTIDELIAKNFEIFMYESFQELSQGLKIHER